MKILIAEQLDPNPQELIYFFEAVFADIADSDSFSEEQNQSLHEWFSVQEMIAYLPHGMLFEARLDTNELVGAIFIGKQNPITWQDGRKMEIFILGIDEKYRKQGIAKRLMQLAEHYAISHQSRKIIVNTHIAMETIHEFYKKLGYRVMGRLKMYYDNGDAIFLEKTLN